MLSADDTDLLEHAPTDLANLLALAEAGQDMANEVARMIRHGTVGDESAAADALARYQAAVQDATQEDA